MFVCLIVYLLSFFPRGGVGTPPSVHVAGLSLVIETVKEYSSLKKFANIPHRFKWGQPTECFYLQKMGRITANFQNFVKSFVTNPGSIMK